MNFYVKPVSYREEGHFFVAHSYGCIYDCEFCFLKTHTKHPYPVFQNIDNVITQIKKVIETYEERQSKNKLRFHLGEVCDALALDKISRLSEKIVEFARFHPQVEFEFRTRTGGNNLDLPQNPPENVIISWSFSPETIWRKYEHKTPSPKARLEASLDAQRKGYRVGLRFDPILIFDQWNYEYEEVIAQLSGLNKNLLDSYIEIGVFRGTQKLFDEIKYRYPRSDILNQEFVMCEDGKLRYARHIRIYVYYTLAKLLRANGFNSEIKLCMEPKWMERDFKCILDKEVEFAFLIT